MQLIVRIPNPRWMRAVTREWNDFWTHHDSWCADEYFELGAVVPSRARRVVLAAQLAYTRYWMAAMCAVLGHELVDDDPGDPERGPQPHVYCVRCGR